MEQNCFEMKSYLRIVSKQGNEKNQSITICSENNKSITLLHPTYHTGDECHVYNFDKVFPSDISQVNLI